MKIQPVTGIGVDTEVPQIRCDSTTEVDPRKESLLDYLFEQERMEKLFAEQEEARKAAEIRKLGFEERVGHNFLSIAHDRTR